MRCFTKQQLSIFWIFLATSCQVTTAAEGVAPPQPAPQQQQPPVPAAAGNYERDNNYVVKTIASSSSSMQPPSMIRRSGGGNSELNEPNDHNNDVSGDRLLSNEITEIANWADTTETFDGGGGGESTSTRNSLQVIIDDNQKQRGRQLIRNADFDRRDTNNDNYDNSKEEDTFNQFAIGTFNHRAVVHQRLLDSQALSHVGGQTDDDEGVKRTGFMGSLSVMSISSGRDHQPGVVEHQPQQQQQEPRSRPPPAMVPLTEDEIDDERIFYDIVDSKHLISRLGSARLNSGRSGLLVGLAMQRAGEQEVTGSAKSPTGGNGVGGGGGGGTTKATKGQHLGGVKRCGIVRGLLWSLVVWLW